MNLIDELKDQGYVTLRNAFKGGAIEDSIAYSKLLIKRTIIRYGDVGNIGHGLYRSTNILRELLVPGLIANEGVLEIFDMISPNEMHLVDGYVHFSTPGNSRQELHRDLDCLELGHYPANSFFAVHFPLCAFTVKSGGTRVIPRTHNSTDEPPRIEDEPDHFIISVPEMNLGDIIVRNARAWHGAGENSSKEIRAMFSFLYSSSSSLPTASVDRDLYFSLPLCYRKWITPR